MPDYYLPCTPITMAMFCRSPHLTARVGLCFLLIIALTYVAFFSRTLELATVDLRSVASDCPGEQRSMHSVCQCPRSREPLLIPRLQKESSCSDHATARGPGQKVVSYSFYGKVRSRYFVGTEVNIKKVARFYPGWAMRLYTNISLTDPEEVATICRLWCTYPHFDLCHVHHLPAPLCNKTEIFGMVWRFFVMGDILVDRFMIRDLDSDIYQREVDAVQEWIKSGKSWHSMRDHNNHWLPILGGMWGGRNVDLNKTITFRKELIRKGIKWQRGYDQTLLTQIVWPDASKDMIQHDSFHCKVFNNTVPWPTRRIGTNFVGLDFPWEGRTYKKQHCPAPCRPKNHPDWLYC